jgi:hypothetical protein
MNPRVKELAEKAGGVVLAGSEIQKFAELIVKECVEQILTGVRTNPPQAEPPEIVQILARRIEQHFGVEE